MWSEVFCMIELHELLNSFLSATVMDMQHGTAHSKAFSPPDALHPHIKV